MNRELLQFNGEDGITRSGIYSAPRGIKAGVVLVPRWGEKAQDSYKSFTDACYDKGIATMVVNLAGHNGSMDDLIENASLENYEMDVAAAIKELREKTRHSRAKDIKIGLYGRGIGGSVCLIYSAYYNTSVCATAVVAPVFYLTDDQILSEKVSKENVAKIFNVSKKHEEQEGSYVLHRAKQLIEACSVGKGIPLLVGFGESDNRVQYTGTGIVSQLRFAQMLGFDHNQLAANVEKARGEGRACVLAPNDEISASYDGVNWIEFLNANHDLSVSGNSDNQQNFDNLALSLFVNHLIKK